MISNQSSDFIYFLVNTESLQSLQGLYMRLDCRLFGNIRRRATQSQSREGSSREGGGRSKGGEGQGIQGSREEQIPWCRGLSGCCQGAPGQCGSREKSARGSRREEQGSLYPAKRGLGRFIICLKL